MNQINDDKQNDANSEQQIFEEGSSYEISKKQFHEVGTLK